jgi:hypothetical protein
LSDQARQIVAELLDQLDEGDDYLSPSRIAKRRRRAAARPTASNDPLLRTR